MAWTLLGSAALGLTMGSAALAADVAIGVPNWPSVNVTANVLKVILEDNLGLKVELQNGTNPVIFEAMDKGTMQIHPEVWLPNQQNLVDKYKAKLAVGGHPADAVQGLCVNKPALDAGISDISALADPAKARLFDSDGNGKGEVFIGATGWASTTVERAKAHGYGYDQTLELKELDEGLAYSQLDAAAKAGKPWVGFCYTPHHLFTIHPDLKLLKEPAYDAAKWKMIEPKDDPDWLNKSTVAMAWPAATLQPVYATSLAKAQPQAASVLAKVDLTSDEISGFAYAVVVDKKDPYEFAKSWVAKNKARVDGWLK
jgi:glycine betaine/proline transport system substrate-binding protein